MAGRRTKGTDRRRKRRIWIPIVLLAAAGVGGFFVYRQFFMKPAPEEFVPEPVTETVVRTDIERTYAGTGKITSGGEVSISTGASKDSTVKVAEVMVKIGDIVRKGDVLYTLDMTSVENEIAIEQQKLALQEQLDALERQAAYRVLSDAQYAASAQYQSATTTMVRKAEDVNSDIVVQVETAEDVIRYQREETDAKAAYESAKAWHEQLKVEHEQRENKTNTLTYDRDLQQAELTHWEEVWKQAHPEGKTEDMQKEDEYKRLQQAITEKNYAIAQATYDMNNLNFSLAQALEDMEKKKVTYDEAKLKAETADEAFKTGKKTIVADARAMEDLAPQTERDNRTAQNAEAAARESIEQNRINSQIEALDAAEKLRKQKEMLDNGIITATMDGMVTEISVAAGEVYTGDKAVTIQNMDRFRVVAEVDEGHIADIYNGMRARITTDSTGATPLYGTVTFASPTPTVAPPTTTADGRKTETTGTVSTAKSTYRVEITLDEANDRLRVGMTAKIEFILVSAQGVIAVPSSCLTMNENGEYVVTIAGAEEEAPEAGTEEEDGIPDWEPIEGEGAAPGSQVVVTTGVSDDFYTEITSGNLEEGTMIEGQNMFMDGGGSDLLEGIY